MAETVGNRQSHEKIRGINSCRGCEGNSLFTAIDLGHLPIANELYPNPTTEIEKFPLHLRICSQCGLGQVEDVVLPERIFRDYRYLSSMSSTFLKHASEFASNQIRESSFSENDWVLEIASNDGYLLKYFLRLGIKVIGIEPALNVAEISRSLGIETITEFFSYDLAVELRKAYGSPKLIIANNVMAHVPNLKDFMSGLSALCGSDTRISVENPSLANIAEGMQFDTIYHEHFSYLSAYSVDNLSKEHGLHLFKIEKISTHGGSYRFWLKANDEFKKTDAAVARYIAQETDNGIFDPDFWNNFSVKVGRILDDFSRWMMESKNAGRRIVGYGAAAKASTLLNVVGKGSDALLAIGDVSLEKQNRFMPPNSIPIISPDELIGLNPSDVIIFPWNIHEEIRKYLKSLLPEDVRLWCAIPELKELD